MKRILLVLGIFIAFVANANADLYSCVDRNGNKTITSNPGEGMTKCELWDSSTKAERELRDNYNKPKRQNAKISRQESNRQRNDEYSNESSTGQRYEYDLSNPADRARYRVDPAAQARDRINPRVQLDRNIGQYGGGAEW